MKNLFKDQQILGDHRRRHRRPPSITAWIMNPQSGPAGWIKGLSASGTQTILLRRLVIILLLSGHRIGW